jgi:hypothetical protein
MAQLIEYLPSMCKALSSNLHTAKNKGTGTNGLALVERLPSKHETLSSNQEHTKKLCS